MYGMAVNHSQISFAVLRRHITLLLRLHIIPSIIVVITYLIAPPQTKQPGHGQGSERPAVHAAVRHAVQVQLQREVHHSHPCMAVFLLPRRNSRTTS